MSWTIELWVEGPTDAAEGDWWDTFSGALPPIVERSLAEMRPHVAADLPRPNPRLLREVLRPARGGTRASGLAKKGRLSSLHAKKLVAAIELHQTRASLIIAVWDSDNRQARVNDRDEINRFLRDHGMRGAATGVCIPCVEAWLLADGQAFKSLFGKGPSQGVPGKPEEWAGTSQQLKLLLASVLISCQQGAGEQQEPAMRELYASLGRLLDLEVLERKCPKGYGELRKALAELVAPCIDAEPSP